MGIAIASISGLRVGAPTGVPKGINKFGVWERMFAHFADDPDMENGMVDSTIVRAHACAAGATKKTVDKLNKRWAAAGAGLAPKFM